MNASVTANTNKIGFVRQSRLLPDHGYRSTIVVKQKISEKTVKSFKKELYLLTERNTHKMLTKREINEIRNKKMRKEFKKYISNFKYDTWITITFKECTASEEAVKRFKDFFCRLNKEEDYYIKYIRLLVFIEKNKYRDGAHIHALATGIMPTKRRKLQKLCCEELGSSKILAPHKWVIQYLVKKYNTEKLDDWQHYTINCHYRNGKRGKRSGK